MHLAVQVINSLQDGTGAQDPAFNANSAKLKTRREREREDLHWYHGCIYLVIRIYTVQ